MLNRRPCDPLCWVLAFFTVSYQHLLLTQIHQGPKPLRLGVAFPTTSSPTDTGTRTHLAGRTHLSYIIVRRPLDLWNRMFNRHQMEITIMQFTGHSLPVHQSMSVPWEFFISSHFISQFPPTRFPLITAIRMCHLLPMHHFGMAFLAGSKGQNITIIYICCFVAYCLSLLWHSPYCNVLCCHQKRFSFSLKVSLFLAISNFSYVWLRLFEAWKINRVVFLPIFVFLLSLFYWFSVGWGCRIYRLLLFRGVRPPNECPDMTLNNLMVKFRQCWSFGEYGVPLHCYCSQVHSGPVW